MVERGWSNSSPERLRDNEPCHFARRIQEGIVLIVSALNVDERGIPEYEITTVSLLRSTQVQPVKKLLR